MCSDRNVWYSVRNFLIRKLRLTAIVSLTSRCFASHPTVDPTLLLIAHILFTHKRTSNENYPPIQASVHDRIGQNAVDALPSCTKKPLLPRLCVNFEFTLISDSLLIGCRCEPGVYQENHWLRCGGIGVHPEIPVQSHCETCPLPVLGKIRGWNRPGMGSAHNRSLSNSGYPAGERRHAFRLTPIAGVPIPAKVEEDDGECAEDVPRAQLDLC
jgi:hypothetical protein